MKNNGNREGFLCMHNFFRRLHLWLSVPFGIVFTFICLTGAILVFEKEITLMMSQVAPQYVETSEITGSPKMPFFRAVRYAHRYLLDTPVESGQMTAGKMIVGTTTLASVFVLISGVILWAPRSWRGLRNRLSVQTKRGWCRLWFDTHVSLGFYASVFLLLMCLTGLTWSFGWYHDLAYSILDKGALTERVETHQEMKESIMRGERKKAMSHGTGRRANETRRTIKHLHMGDLGGIFTQVIWFLSALIGAILTPTGYYLWYKRLRK